MCRIYGHFNAAVSRGELDTVAALQQHGGPDAHGVRCGATWSIGSNRLAIMDPDGGRQPYQLADGSVTVAFNGEIYNHAELRARLQRRGYRITDHCDGSILPALYDCYGDRFPEHLNGMYAIAVLDLRARPRLVLVTDHVGMKPIYYCWRPGRGELYFSSEIPSLLAFRAVSGRSWLPGLEAYLATKTPLGEQTMFEAISVLPPGAVAVCDPVSGLRIHRPTGPPADPGETGADVRAAVRRETERLLVADVPVATITSGGLDSSLVTAFAAQANPSLHTFTIGYKGSWPDDERRYASQVAGQANVADRQVEVDPAVFPDLLPQVVWHLGQPNADPITLSTYALFAAVSAAGFKVVLTGDGADEVFGGYARMQAAARAKAAQLPWLEAYLESLAAVPARLRRRLYTEAYAAEVAAGPAAIPPEAIHLLRDGPGTVLDRITSFELGYRLPAYHLRRVDHLSMAHAVEVRLPYCQRRLCAMGRRLPDRQRIGPAETKLSLRRAATGLLPPAVLARPKQPFTLPVAAMLTPGWPLWDFAQDTLSTSRLRQAGQIEPSQVRALFAAQASRPENTAALALWALLVYQIWSGQPSGPGPGGGNSARSEKALATGCRTL